jgi:hypothetical protein
MASAADSRPTAPGENAGIGKRRRSADEEGLRRRVVRQFRKPVEVTRQETDGALDGGNVGLVDRAPGK